VAPRIGQEHREKNNLPLFWSSANLSNGVDSGNWTIFEKGTSIFLTGAVRVNNVLYDVTVKAQYELGRTMDLTRSMGGGGGGTQGGGL